MEGLTFGEKAVGLSFNPSADGRVDTIKKQYAAVIDFLDNARQEAAKDKNMGAVRHLSTAITQAEDAQMRAVKGLTWKD